jgi:amidohydrolase
MIAAGVMDEPPVDGIFSLHLNPGLEEGTVAVKPGYATVSSAGFVLKLIGRGGHVARPQEAVDPVAMAGTLITNVQSIVSRRSDPLEPTIVAFGSVHGGTADNIIPEEVTLTGTIRTLVPEMRARLAGFLEKTAEGVAAGFGGRHRLRVTTGYPSVFNHPQLTHEFIVSAAAVVPQGKAIELQRPVMTGEDVAYFHRKAPGVHWHLGTMNETLGFTHALHNPRFDFNEEVMAIGAAVHAQAVSDFLVNRARGALEGGLPSPDREKAGGGISPSATHR